MAHSTSNAPAATLTGVLERIIFLNEENHYTIAEFRPDEKSAPPSPAKSAASATPAHPLPVGREPATASPPAAKSRPDLIGQFFPADVEFIQISRTINDERLVDEWVIRFTHDKVMTHLLSGVAPTGKRVEMAVALVVGVRGAGACRVR